MYLNCHSFHSLRYGTIPLTDLVEMAAKNGVTTLALTDINTITGIYDFVKECGKFGIKPLVGMEFRENNKLLFVGIAKNREGIAELCRLRTDHNLKNTEVSAKAPKVKNSYFIYPLENCPKVLAAYEFV